MNRSDEYQIQIRGLEKTFGTHKVLRGVDLDVERGHINVVIGGSGQGKSVLMKHLMGLLRPDAGHIWVDGEDVVGLNDVQLNELRRKFGMAFQYAALFDSLTVEQNVAFPLVEHTNKSKTEIHELVVKRLDSLGLRNIEKKFPAELSGGMRKRVGLARALILEPQILLYDEPTTGLDPVATKNVDDMIRDISIKTGVTSVVISHDMASTFRIADRISMLYDGKIAISATPDEFKKSQLPFVREFVEMSGTVTFEKHYELGDDDVTRPGES
ncbi:MAG TPA: ABC transporter ATP-binding protein [Polyangia bacterium]|jgi:phospholipid/cholesterol/gamma-HCH transport system ATP-binding protein|nr:ABC transporter ATP-binding protein [Polyangia bacterium]